MAANDSRLREINDEVVQTMIPAIVYVALLMLIGIVGNPLVIIFYGVKLKPTASYMFIVSVAVFDLLVCCVSMPLEIVDMVQFYTFESAAACKILRFINYFASITSGVFLIAIAVDRYRKICRPFKAQITNQLAKIAIVVAIMIGFFFAWPSFVFYDVHEVNVTEAAGVIGFDCTTNRDSDYKVYITIYNIVLFLAFLVSIVSLIVLYALVGKQLFNLRSFRFYVAKDKSSGPSPSQISQSLKSENLSVDYKSENVNVKTMNGKTGYDNKDCTDDMRDGALSTIRELQDDEDFGSVSRPGSAIQHRPASSNSINLSARSGNKIKALISTRVAPERFNLDREYTGLTGLTESSGRTYKSTSTDMTALSESLESIYKSSNNVSVGLDRENTGMTTMTGLSESSGRTFKTVSYGGQGLNREETDLTEMTELSENSFKGRIVPALYRESSGMTELTDISGHSNSVKVLRPNKSTANKSKPRLNSATTVSVRSSISNSSNENNVSKFPTRDAHASGSIDKKKMKAQNLDTKKYTIIMMSITTAFIISFLPYLGLITWRTLAPDYEINLLNKSELVAFQIGLRSFLLNSATNPLIYGFLNSEFRQFVLSVLCGMCGCFRNDQKTKKHSSNENSRGSSKT